MTETQPTLFDAFLQPGENAFEFDYNREPILQAGEGRKTKTIGRAYAQKTRLLEHQISVSL